MNGIYCNSILPMSTPFIFKKYKVNKSIRLNTFNFSKVGRWVPFDFKGNIMIAPECLSRWVNEN